MVLVDTESASHLKPWLVRTLEPICDAEPGALADYILALLQHNVPENEMREELAVQLDEFLEKECSSFVDTLFTVIRTKSYMPYSAIPSPKPQDSGIPIPLDALLPSPSDRIRKRSTTDDERDGRPPAKGPRLNTDGQFSRYGNGGDGRMGAQSSGAWGRPPVDRFGNGGMGMGMGGYPGQMVAMGMNGMNGMNGMGLMNGRRPQGYQPPDQKRGVCRDYHNNGYCARGATCKYSHGDDAVVPGQLFPGAGMPFMPMFPGGPTGMPFMQNAAYDPHEARMDMRPMGGRPPHQRAPLLPRIQQEDGSRVVHPINASGELPVIQDLTPIVPQDAPSLEPLPHGDVDMHQVNNQGPSVNPPHLGGGYNPMMNNMNGGYLPNMDVDNNAHMPGMRPPTLGRGQGQYRGGRGGPGGRGRGTFGGEVHNFRPEKRNDKTLVVEKIPEDKLSLEGVNDWFKRFGTVTNVAIDPTNAKALVSFSNHDEAHAAWKSEDAVFGNRFVKVFWHRPMEGHGQIGQRMLAASAPLVANMTSKSASPAPQQQPPSAGPVSTSTTPAAAAAGASATPRKSATPATSSAATLAIEEKRQQLEQTIAEQNALIASYSTAPADEKKGIMARLRKIDEEMKALKESISSSLPPAASTSASSSSTAAASAKKSVNTTADRERLERERLDKELDMPNGTGTSEGGGETTEDLKAKLEKLKAEAASLGLDSALPSSSYRGGYRGRGRGAPRSYFRGATMRGGPPRASMKLDNRPKKLLVKNVPEDSAQALRDWYETTGQLESVEPVDGAGGSTYIVSFKSRSAAEAGLSKGANIPIVGSVQISWYTGKEGASTVTPTQTTKALPSESSSSAPAASHSSEYGHEAPPRSPESHAAHHLHEEEIIASGWGGGDDEDGMGLL
ncbi:RNA-binding protein 27 [Psilocybe cubensis]|uniref:C3H1-type domain-containing protein n=2 Tax=Psilocybe cubensis TaxID=181762 RepID=A0A8H7YBF7_PSICU|nr:RNA-binding protein 27 [Psilocybe cubensis]KAH9487162.1 RNA-binding protein 27 [Psilocybe cubensis]